MNFNVGSLMSRFGVIKIVKIFDVLLGTKLCSMVEINCDELYFRADPILCDRLEWAWSYLDTICVFLHPAIACPRESLRPSQADIDIQHSKLSTNGDCTIYPRFYITKYTFGSVSTSFYVIVTRLLNSAKSFSRIPFLSDPLALID